MKHLTKRFLFILLVFVCGGLQAQTEEKQTVISLNAGYSLIGQVIQTALGSGNENVSSGVSPVFVVGADHGLTKNFSIGLSGALQTMKVEGDYTYTNDDLETIEENIELSMKRWQVALTPRFHYGKNADLDMFSGLRVGITGTGGDLKTSDPDLEDDFNFGRSRFSLGLTAFGFRYYFTEMVGANMELNLGAPYIFTGGINFRF